MKIKTLTSCFFLAFAISSCIQDEALNAEADIETCSVPGDVLTGNRSLVTMKSPYR